MNKFFSGIFEKQILEQMEVQNANNPNYGHRLLYETRDGRLFTHFDVH